MKKAECECSPNKRCNVVCFIDHLKAFTSWQRHNRGERLSDSVFHVFSHGGILPVLTDSSLYLRNFPTAMCKGIKTVRENGFTSCVPFLFEDIYTFEKMCGCLPATL